MHLITAFVTILMLDTMIFGFIYPENRAGENDPLCVEFINFTTEGSFDLHVMSGTDAQQIMKNYGVSSEYELMDRIEGCRSAAELGLIGSNQILGLVRFFETLIGAVAIFFIVYSGVAIIASMGEEETIKKHRKTLLWSFIGLAIVILANTVITRFFFVVDPITGNAGIDTATGIYTIAGITNFIAGFVGVFAVVAIIVAGIIWVANFGNDEIANKAKKIILSAVIGVVLAVSAYAIVNTLTSARSKGGSGTSIGISI